ncbi:MAG: hypothetical protein [Caudoviricetes sp.]|nr:MAG: hypothetical protein [Caudoviricetes sp.]
MEGMQNNTLLVYVNMICCLYRNGIHKELFNMKQSRELTKFYNAYHDWLMNGAPIHDIFSRCAGLCHNLTLYCVRNKIDKNFSKQMGKQFEKAGLDKEYPFGEEQYINCFMNDTSHLDPNRIAWVKAHLTEEVNKKFTLVSKI